MQVTYFSPKEVSLFIHSLTQVTNILGAYYMLGSVLGAASTDLSKRLEHLPSWRLYSSEEDSRHMITKKIMQEKPLLGDGV